MTQGKPPSYFIIYDRTLSCYYSEMNINILKKLFRVAMDPSFNDMKRFTQFKIFPCFLKPPDGNVRIGSTLMLEQFYLL